MAGSRAVSAREPGQIREEAALSGSAHAPRTSLAGAKSWRARPRARFDDGCTVHFLIFLCPVGESNLDRVRRALASFNSEGVESVIDLFAPDFETEVPASMSAEPDLYSGHAGVRRWFAGFEGFMEGVRIVAEEVVEVSPDVVRVSMNLVARGVESRIEVEQAGFQVFRMRDGLVRRIENFPTREEAVAAAGG